MMPIILIITGIILCFVSSIALLRFSSQVQEKISEINDLFSSDVFLMHKELREELDELNFSYYEILERQDERISSLETKLDPMSSRAESRDLTKVDEPVISTEVDSTNIVITSEADSTNTVITSEADSTNTVITSEANRRSRENSPDDSNPLNRQVLVMLKEGASKEEIASQLDIGVGVVNMICDVYTKQP